ncbi:hypothetical protein ACN4EK_06855 [Pantanalinema rosaneae CENA516]|uniref:hypothetical protein n=1 Tax=Pantanalinema rosaneae TaxID=1620701 RepID=UPI003D6DE83C
MAQNPNESLQIQQVTGLQPKHFADLIRAAQLVFDPAGGVSGRVVEVDWPQFGISSGVLENLRELGRQYQYASPYVAIDVIWSQLTPETRSWLIENKKELWRLEEIFPALDED